MLMQHVWKTTRDDKLRLTYELIFTVFNYSKTGKEQIQVNPRLRSAISEGLSAQAQTK